jgi:hypothetical protein
MVPVLVGGLQHGGLVARQQALVAPRLPGGGAARAGAGAARPLQVGQLLQALLLHARALFRGLALARTSW